MLMLMNMYTHTYMHASIRTHMHACVRACVRACMRACVCACMRAYSHPSIHACMHKLNMYIYKIEKCEGAVLSPAPARSAVPGPDAGREPRAARVQKALKFRL